MTVFVNKPLQLEVGREGRAIVITAHGSAGVIDAPRLQEQLARLAEKPNTVIVLDLSDLEFLGPDGIDALLTAHQLSKVQHGQIRLVNPNHEIRRMLEVTRLTEVFPVYGSVKEAAVIGEA
jgi:anti-anti-sigma factor